MDTYGYVWIMDDSAEWIWIELRGSPHLNLGLKEASYGLHRMYSEYLHSMDI